MGQQGALHCPQGSTVVGSRRGAALPALSLQDSSIPRHTGPCTQVPRGRARTRKYRGDRQCALPVHTSFRGGTGTARPGDRYHSLRAPCSTREGPPAAQWCPQGSSTVRWRSTGPGWHSQILADSSSPQHKAPCNSLTSGTPGWRSYHWDTVVPPLQCKMTRGGTKQTPPGGPMWPPEHCRLRWVPG